MPRRTKSRRLLFAGVYPTSQAGTRLRGEQFRPYFEDANIELAIWSFIPERYCERWFRGSHVERLLILVLCLFRLGTFPLAVLTSEVVVVHRELIPFGSPLMEAWVSKKRPLIWDIDDSVWASSESLFLKKLPSWFRKPAGKYETICSLAAQVWAGSEVVASWCRRLNRTTIVVPTVVSVPRQRPDRKQTHRIGWIGSPSTGQFLQQILPALEAVDPKPVLIVVGSDIEPPEELLTETFQWSADEEARMLENISVGLYPVDLEHPLAEGKAGLKAILYMSQGIPSVVTPTSTNRKLVRHGIEGLHARTPQEWTESVQQLLDDEQLWSRCSLAAHQRANEEFSLRLWGPRVLAFVQELMESGRYPPLEADRM